MNENYIVMTTIIRRRKYDDIKNDDNLINDETEVIQQMIAITMMTLRVNSRANLTSEYAVRAEYA